MTSPLREYVEAQTAASVGASSTSSLPTPESPPGDRPESLTHMLQVALRMPPACPLELALDTAGITSYNHLISLRDEDIDKLEYAEPLPDDEDGNERERITKPHMADLNSLRVIIGFVYHRNNVLKDMITEFNCMEKITAAAISTYRGTGAFLTFGNQINAPKPLVNHSSYRSKADEFDRSIRRDISHFPVLSNDKQWDTYHRELEAIMHSYGLQDVIEPTFTPSTHEDMELFLRQKRYMYHVFTKTLLTDKGKQIVRKHPFDAC